jgi:hypothetical protein
MSGQLDQVSQALPKPQELPKPEVGASEGQLAELREALTAQRIAEAKRYLAVQEVLRISKQIPSWQFAAAVKETWRD